MKYLVYLSIIVLCVVSTVSAAAKSVWYTGLPSEKPSTLSAGDSILIYAKIENVLPDPITYVLAFSAQEKTIANKTLTLPGYSRQDISIPWTIPAEPVDVTAAIVKATDAQKKEMKALVGPIGTVTVPLKPDTLSEAKIFFASTVAKLEEIRLQQYASFSAQKKEANGIIDSTTLRDVHTILQPESPNESQQQTNPTSEKTKKTIGQYAKLVYSTLGEAFFKNKTIFFVSIILIGLLIVRGIIRLLFR